MRARDSWNSTDNLVDTHLLYDYVSWTSNILSTTGLTSSTNSRLDMSVALSVHTQLNGPLLLELRGHGYDCCSGDSDFPNVKHFYDERLDDLQQLVLPDIRHLERASPIGRILALKDVQGQD